MDLVHRQHGEVALELLLGQRKHGVITLRLQRPGGAVPSKHLFEIRVNSA